MKTKINILVVLAMVLSMVSGGIVPNAFADSNSLNFESYSVGNINGQDGWTKTGAYDVAVVANAYGYASFGVKSLRISNAVTSDSFGDQTFARPLIDAVGETDAIPKTFSVGSRQTRFEMQFDIASAVPTAQQPGLSISVSPDRGDGARMSYLRFVDGAGGIDVFFSDTPGTTNPANFTNIQVGVALARAVPHTVKLVMDVVDGPSNDIVRVYIDGTLVHTGTSWENYYRYDPESYEGPGSRIVKTVLFRAGGTSVPANLEKGFLIDNVTTYSGPTPPPNPTLPVFCGAETSTYTVNLSGVTNLWGYQFQAHYDPLLATATGAFVDSWFNTAGGSKPWGATCSGGTCMFGVSKVAGTGVNPVDGSGPIATITLAGIAPGAFNLTFDKILLGDKDGTPIAQTLTAVPLTVCGIASASGVVSLQGRTTPIDSGKVKLTDGVFGPYETTFSAVDGAWSIPGIKVMPGGTSYTFDATHGLYLGNRMTQVLMPGANAVAATKLRGGDANNDGAIGLGDITIIAGDFGNSGALIVNPNADITGDGNVNILDLVLAGGNYGLSAPQGW
jgi:hypothetical protein